MADDAYELINNSKAKSKVWAHFSLKRKRENNEIVTGTAYCRHCNKSVQCGGGTTNLRVHLERHHKMFVLEELPNQIQRADAHTFPLKKEQPTLLEVFKRSDKYKPSSDRYKQITDKVAYFIVKDIRPFSIVQNKGFQDLIHTLDPKYSMPSKTYFSETAIPALYMKIKHEVKSEINKAEYIALTTDGWTSSATESYVTITSSFINDEWCMKTHVLQTRALPVSHTGVNIANVINQAIVEWGVPQNPPPPLVTDNAANMGVAAKQIGCEPHLQCFAHTLNLAVQKSLKLNGVSRLLGRVRRVVAFFHRSTTATALLKENAKLLGVREVKLIHDVCTRWNSAVDMLERFLELEPAVYAVLISNELKSKDSDVSTLSEDDIRIAEQVKALLIPIRAISVALCKETSPTASIILPVQKRLETMLSDVAIDPPIIRQMKSTLVEDLRPRYGNLQEFLEESSVLDPRFETTVLTEERAMMVKARISLKVTAQGPSNIKQEPADNPRTTETSTTDANIEEPPLPQLDPAQLPQLDPVNIVKNDPEQQQTGLASILEDVVVTRTEKATKSTLDQVREELDLYLATDPIPLGNNPLTWWKEESWRLPHIAQLAKKRLCVQATSVASERVFSTAGDIVSAQRSALNTDKVDMLIFLKKNLI